MSAQFDLFGVAPPLPARATDPATSREAALSLDLPELEALVLDALKAAGPSGLILDEIMDATGLDKVTASPRLRPLCNKGLVRESGETRRGEAGRQQTVWVAI